MDTENIVLITRLSKASNLDPDWDWDEVDPAPPLPAPPLVGVRLLEGACLRGATTPPES